MNALTSSRPGGPRFGLAFAVLFSLPALAPAEVVISEFMAVNVRTVQDEDGDYSDWIEFYNDGPQPVDLEGWYLTDDKSELTRWSWPAVTLGPGERIVVFASEKNRRDPGSELHTNFRLNSRGEYLALIEPDGVTPHFHFDPEYPGQYPDVSYGLFQEATEVPMVTGDATGRYLIPTGDIGTGWRQAGFADGGWTPGPTGFGFGADYDAFVGTDIGQMRGASASVYTRFPFNVSNPSEIDDLTLFMTYDDGFVAYLNGTEVARRNSPVSPSWSSAATAEHGQPEVSVMSQNFDNAGTSYTLRAHGTDEPPAVRSGGPTGRYLRLMPDGVGNLANTIGFAYVPGPTGGVFAEFDYRMPTTGQADGFAFALLETATWGLSGAGPDQSGFVWERPAVDKAFCVGFDIWPAGEENSVNINWDGAQISTEFIQPFELHNGVFNHVRVEVVRDGNDSLITVVITTDIHGNPGVPLKVFDGHRIPGMRLGDARVCFGGRTGGAFTSVDLDNIRVEFTPGSGLLEPEAIDISDSLGLLNDGGNVLAVHGLNRSSTDEDLLVYPELHGLITGDLSVADRHYYTDATPGWVNGAGLPGVAPEPGFSQPPGAYPSTISLALSAGGAAGAVVRYTTDGSEPTAASPRYISPISISTTTLVRAKTFQPNRLPSATISNLYMRLSTSARGFDSNLPIVIVDTRGRGIGSGSFTPCHALVIDVDPDSGRAEISGEVNFGGNGGIKQRGSSSSGFPKKQFQLEVQDAFGEDRDVSILGMPEESDWILYAPYSDKSLMRNFLSYKWSNDIGRYAVRTRFVEMFLNTGTGDVSYNSHYVGVYVLMEKIKRNPERVDVERLTAGDNSAPEITGGYIIKKDRLDPGDSGFTTSRGQTLAYYEPKEREITGPQASYLRNYFNSFESALYGASFRNPTTGYARYFDPAASIDHHILTEMCKNIDGYRLSTFAYKPRNDKIYMGPIWDYNLSLGNADYLQGWMPSNWYYPQLGPDAYPWYGRLFQDPDYEQAYTDRWTELRRGPLQADRLLRDIDEAAALLDEAQVRNFVRWRILGTRVWPNWYIAQTYAEEIAWMKGWLRDRLTWMDSQFPTPPALSAPSQLISPGFPLAMTARTGTIYYTVDGSDPRLPGGGVSPSAIEYESGTGGVLLSPETHGRVRARVPTDGTMGLAWTSRTYSDVGWRVNTDGIGVGYENGSGYEGEIGLDVGADMFNSNGSVYIRVPFDVSDPSVYDFMSLGMKYDDGFVAYLNGQKVAEANAPASPQWNSLAAAQHDDTAALSYQDYDISQHLGLLVAGTNVLAIHAMNFTLDSSDLIIVPRITAGGETSGDSLILDDFTHIRARTRRGSDWSGPSEARYPLEDGQFLRITEMLYHPPDPDAASPHGDEDFEFIEVQNIGVTAADLRGVRFVNGIDFEFTYGAVTSLAPGEYVVVVRNLDAFQSVYDTTGMPIAGEYEGFLENQGETIELVNGADETIQQFNYQDFWYPITDGAGYSLVIQDAGAELEAWSTKEGWRSSDLQWGTPGSGEDITGGRQLPGDANQDSFLDLGDAVSLLLLLFRGDQSSPPCGEGETVGEGGNLVLLDANGDNSVDSSDAVYLLQYLYRDGPAHVDGVNCMRIEGCPTACSR